MVVVDAHCHLGGSTIWPTLVTEEELISTMDANQVDVAIVQPLAGVPDVKAAHDRVANAATKYKGRIFGMACPDPHMRPADYTAELARCVDELGFVGVKIQTWGHLVDPKSSAAELVFHLSREHEIPVMVHTGPGGHYALPSLIMPRAKEFPEVDIILAHCGLFYYFEEACMVARECRNVWLETSYAPIDHVKSMVEEFGPDRVMMGSDLPLNMSVSLFMYHNIGLTEADLEKTLGKTAKRVFKLPI